MLPKVDVAGLKKVAWWEHLVRVGFGGVVTAGAGLIAHRFGPTVGGLFLAFPAILPASLTLVKNHDGRKSAEEDAKGARLGAVGLAAFALCVALLAECVGPWVLALAGALWLATGTLLWWLVYGRRATSSAPRSSSSASAQRGQEA